MRLIDVDAMHKPIYAEDDNITGYGMTQEERDSYNEGIRYALRLVANCPTVDAVPVVQREAVMQALNKYFSIGDSYTYELTRVKEAFYIGTMTLDDFEEWNEDNISDLCDYLMKEIFGPNCGAKMDRGEAHEEAVE